jgi:hypothetical protein
VSFGIGAASVREIDRVNIYHATVIAMRRALSRLSVIPSCVLIDGKPIRTLEISHTAIVGGDDVCYTIACASILAKVTRDRLMQSLAGRYPNYLWERNVGYATLAHLQGLASWTDAAPSAVVHLVRQLLLDFTGDDGRRRHGHHPDAALLATALDATTRVWTSRSSRATGYLGWISAYEAQCCSVKVVRAPSSSHRAESRSNPLSHRAESYPIR